MGIEPSFVGVITVKTIYSNQKMFSVITNRTYVDLLSTFLFVFGNAKVFTTD